jgi:hypothetical protein
MDIRSILFYYLDAFLYLSFNLGERKQDFSGISAFLINNDNVIIEAHNSLSSILVDSMGTWSRL